MHLSPKHSSQMKIPWSVALSWWEGRLPRCSLHFYRPRSQGDYRPRSQGDNITMTHGIQSKISVCLSVTRKHLRSRAARSGRGLLISSKDRVTYSHVDTTKVSTRIYMLTHFYKVILLEHCETNPHVYIGFPSKGMRLTWGRIFSEVLHIKALTCRKL